MEGYFVEEAPSGRHPVFHFISAGRGGAGVGERN